MSVDLGRLPYILATYNYREGFECDHAAGIIRRRLPQFLTEIAEKVRLEMEPFYNPEKERKQ